MTIFFRYVFRQSAGAFFLVLLSLSGIVWISLALRELNVVTAKGQSTLTLLKMTTLGLPNFMAVIAPFALLIAVIHTLNRLNGDSEIIVYTASGASNWAIARPLITLAALVTIAVAFINHFAMPWSLRQLREIIIEVRTDLLTQVIQPGRFSSPEQGVTLHIRARSPSGILQGLIVHDTRDPKQVQSYLAEQGIIVKQDDNAYLMMEKGHILRRAGNDKPTQIIAFSKYAVDLDRFEGKAANAPLDLKPRERYMSELVSPEATSQHYKAHPGRFTAEIHERFANPLYPLAFTFMALAVVGYAQSTRQNRMQRTAGAVATAVAVRGVGLASNNLVVINSAAAPLLYIIPLIAIIVSVVLIHRGASQRGGLSWSERVFEVAGLIVQRMVDVLRTRRLTSMTGG
jgi:lipopolysaccharide export system permease protein